MSSTSPESLALLGRAAELRAAGTPWADAATQLAVGVDELRRLAAGHARDYDRLARRARAELLRETLDAALAALRARLNSPDPGVSLLAATTIVRYDLARMRHGLKDAGTRLERDSRRSPRKLTIGAHNARAGSVPESPEVPARQEVVAAKNVTQSGPPAGASAGPSRPAATPPAAPPPVAAGNPAPLDDAARRRLRLIDNFALGRTAHAAPAQDKRQTLEVDRLIRGWLSE